MKKLLLVYILTCFFISCKKQGEIPFSNNNLNSTLWMQTAAEYQANSLQVYQMAAAKLNGLLEDQKHTALLEQKSGYEKLPPAIILDVDETILDNSPYQAMLVIENKKFSSITWNQWVALKQAPAIPGVVDFLNTAQQMGVTIFYVTNRKCSGPDNDPCPQDKQTFENLQSVGINNVTLDNVLLLGEKDNWGRDKTSRRHYVAQNYRVIMLFGDNLGDFIEDDVQTVEERNNLIKQNQDRWGKSWFMLANPTYGGWQSILHKPLQKNLTTW